MHTHTCDQTSTSALQTMADATASEHAQTPPEAEHVATAHLVGPTMEPQAAKVCFNRWIGLRGLFVSLHISTDFATYFWWATSCEFLR